MRISTSTEICNEILRTKEPYYNCKDAIDAIAWAGYQVMDINLHQFGAELEQENWRDWVAEHRAYAEEKGLPITQGHAHMYGSFDFYDYTQEEIEYHTNLICRDIEAASIFGVPWVVIHPDSYMDETWYSRKQSMEKNIERFKKYGEVAAKYGVGIAIENMIDKRSLRRFGAGTEDLIELVDRLGDEKLFGICWDTGHANLHQMNQGKAIREVGIRLKALHINDNLGTLDHHLLPFHGTVNWKEVMGALKEVEYKGDFTYEIHGFARGFDAGFHHQGMRFARELAEYLLTL